MITPRVAVGLTLIALLASGSASGASSLVFDYPPAPEDARDARIRDAMDALDVTPAYVLGDAGVADATVKPIDATTYRITIRKSHAENGSVGPPLTIMQNTTSGDKGSLHLVRPADARIAIADGGGTGLLTVIAPPGTFESEAPPAESAEAFARRLGVPPANASAWRVGAPLDVDAQPNLPLYNGLRFIEEQDDMRLGHVFMLECADCTVAVRHAPGLAKNLDYAVAYFTPQGELYAFRTSAWVNRSASGVLDEEAARERVRDALEARGHAVSELTFQSQSLDSRMRLVNGWTATVNASGASGGVHLLADQDALTGELVRPPYTETAAQDRDDTHGDGVAGGDGPMGAIPGAGALAAAAVLALVGAHRKKR